MKIGIISDIHEDKIRLIETIQQCERRHCEMIVCLGDITGFDVRHYRYLSTRDASYCIDLIKDQCRIVIAGNHDLFSIRRIPANCGLFDFREDWYEMDFSERKKAGERYVWLYEEHDLSPCLSRQDRDYLYQLPEYDVLEYQGKRILFSHSIVPDIGGSAIWRPREAKDFLKHFTFMQEQGCSLGISGHFHPAGAEVATENRYGFRSFGQINMPKEPAQIIVPCVAAGSGFNGFMILDLKDKSGEIIPLKTRRVCFRRFV